MGEAYRLEEVAVPEHEFGNGGQAIVFCCTWIESNLSLSEDLGEERGTGGADGALNSSGAGTVFLVSMGHIYMATEDGAFFSVVSGSEVWKCFEVAKSTNDLFKIARGGVLSFAGMSVYVLGNVVAVSAYISEVTDDALVLGLVGG